MTTYSCKLFCFKIHSISMYLFLLYLSIFLQLFGFLSCFLWGANLWFVFKETVWHKEPGAAAAAVQKSDAEVPHQEVPGESMP